MKWLASSLFSFEFPTADAFGLGGWAPRTATRKITTFWQKQKSEGGNGGSGPKMGRYQNMG